MRLIVNRRLAGVPRFPLLALLALLACPAAAQAQAALDPSFGSGGLARIANPIGEGTFWAEDANDVAVQPDGKILVAADGRGQTPSTGPWCATCRTPARPGLRGRRRGGAHSDRPGRGSRDRAAARRQDRAGRGLFKPQDANDDSVACVMRLLPDGRLDRSFSRDGVVRVDHGYGDDLLIGVEMQGRRIVAFGEGRAAGEAASPRSA